MVVQVLALMWMRTTINYQHAKGLSMMDALKTLYADGGIARFYQGLGPALLQGPLSRALCLHSPEPCCCCCCARARSATSQLTRRRARTSLRPPPHALAAPPRNPTPRRAPSAGFGDTAANAGIVALLAQVTWPQSVKTALSSVGAALFRILLMPIDTFKTTMQVQGAAGLDILWQRMGTEGLSVFFGGALATSVATFMGHYPWFFMYNFLQTRVPTSWNKNVRSAFMGVLSSGTSDIISNSVRVVKTTKQTSKVAMTYLEAVQAIVARDGVQGVFFNGLSTKLISNAVSAMLFTICWRAIEEKIAARGKADKKRA